MKVSPEQIRAARALLRLGQSELAEQAHVSVSTIRRIEAESGIDQVAAPTLDSIGVALERAGVEFIPYGVRRRPVLHPDAQARYEAAREISLRAAELLRGHVLLTDDDLYDENGLPK